MVGSSTNSASAGTARCAKNVVPESVRALGACYTVRQRMPGKKHNLGWVRGFAAACLTLCLSFSSLAPIAAGSFNDESSADAPCCKGKCCRRRPRGPNPNRGPVVAATCCADCGGAVLGSVGTSGRAVFRLRVSTLAIQAGSGRVPVSSILPQSRISANSLCQRPPPSSPLA